MKDVVRRLKVMLVEDSPPMQAVLARLVRAGPGLELIALADCAADAKAGFDASRPDVVILDLGLRKGNGLALLKEIKQCSPECRVMVFTGYDAEQYRIRCLELGATWFLSKNRQYREMTQILREIGVGRPTGRDPPKYRQRRST